MERQITATLEDLYIQNGARGVKLYYPIFSYFYNGKTYTERSFQNESGKTLSSMELEKNYDIFISEKNPEKFVLTKKISYIKAMVALLVGVPLLFIGLHYIILELSLFFHILRYL